MKNNIEKIKTAYGWMYKIESSLKSLIEYSLRHEYGLGWKTKIYKKRELETAYFHEVVSCFDKYPPLTDIFTSQELYNLYEIRLSVIKFVICSFF